MRGECRRSHSPPKKGYENWENPYNGGRVWLCVAEVTLLLEKDIINGLYL